MKKEFLSTRILHGALVVGSLLFFVVVYFGLGIDEEVNAEPDTFDMFYYLIPIVVLSSILVAKMVDRSKLAAFGGKGGLKEKLFDYRTRVIIRSALTEGAALFAVVALLLTNNMIYAIYFGIGWLALVYFRPNAAELSNDYNLTTQEEQELQQD
jgi:hypothetical protein